MSVKERQLYGANIIFYKFDGAVTRENTVIVSILHQ
jgi:hypothetical protein